MKDKRTVMLLVAVGALIVLAVVVIAKTSTGSDAVSQSNITDFAKKIDNTKSNSPSVPASEIARGFGGKRH